MYTEDYETHKEARKWTPWSWAERSRLGDESDIGIMREGLQDNHKNVLEDLLEKPENFHRHMGNVSREMEMIKTDHVEVLEMKNMLL